MSVKFIYFDFFRLDKDQALRRSIKNFIPDDPDYYEFEGKFYSRN